MGLISLVGCFILLCLKKPIKVDNDDPVDNNTVKPIVLQATGN